MTTEIKPITDPTLPFKRAAELANRWVRAWGPGYTHGWAQGVIYEDVGPDGPRIAFRAQPDYGGIGTNTWYPIRFLEDDTGLEEAAVKWWVDYETIRLARLKREEVLEATPEVQEWKQLKGAGWWTLTL